MRRWVIAGCALAVVAVGVTAAGASGLGAGRSPGRSTATGGRSTATGTPSAADEASPETVPAAGATVSAPPVVVPPRLVATTASTIAFPGTPPRLDWPAAGQAAVEVAGMGDLGTSGAQTETPTASVAKAMTAYLVLTDHPLTGDENGPTLIVSRSEADAYGSEAAQNESLVRVRAGERLTERQALEALMLASADNVAQVLARWDAGSVSAFVAKMNATAARLGMRRTWYTDPSGLTPSTVSTAGDQVKLGEAAMDVPAFAAIVDMSSARIPVAGFIRNYNSLLGTDGVVGIKTGSTGAAGGCLLFAARVPVGRTGRTVTIIGAVLHQPGSAGTILPNALAASRVLIVSVERALASATLVRSAATVAVIRQPPDDDIALVPTEPLTVVGWPGLTYDVTVGGTVGQPTLTLTGPGADLTVPLVRAAGAVATARSIRSDALNQNAY